MPLLEVLWNRYGKSYYENCLHEGSIELLAPEYARGRSVSGVMAIDEAQSMARMNSTPCLPAWKMVQNLS